MFVLPSSMALPLTLPLLGDSATHEVVVVVGPG
jgi:hypothetical protein